MSHHAPLFEAEHEDFRRTARTFFERGGTTEIQKEIIGRSLGV